MWPFGKSKARIEAEKREREEASRSRAYAAIKREDVKRQLRSSPAPTRYDDGHDIGLGGIASPFHPLNPFSPGYDSGASMPSCAPSHSSSNDSSSSSSSSDSSSSSSDSGSCGGSD